MEKTALLIRPGDEDNTAEVTITPNTTLGDLLGKGVSIELWPYQYTRDVIHGPNNSKYTYELYVDESGVLKELEVNLCATLAVDPLGEFKGRLVRGPALLISTSKQEPNLTLNDWKNICKGVWYEEDLVEKNCNGKYRM